mmetsp:Transcript_38011/g.27654  ORF Transcript_38011/g.27654 Transcript_38011/m.27654 type:complete len:161 (+) Transcript_38011:1013-1495(+)
MESFDLAKDEIIQEIQDIDGNDIEENMLKERRDWIQEQKARFPGNLPNNLEKFYKEKEARENPISPEEEEAKRAAEEAAAADGKKKDKKKDGGKKGAKKKKGKGKGDGEKIDKDVKIFKVSEIVSHFDVFYDDYNQVWANYDETGNVDQEFDRKMATEEV